MVDRFHASKLTRSRAREMRGAWRMAMPGDIVGASQKAKETEGAQEDVQRD